MTNRLAKVVEAAGDEHDSVSKARLDVAEALFDDPDALDPGQHMLDGDPDLADQAIVLPFLFRALLAPLLLERLIDHHTGRCEGLERTVLMQLAVRWKAQLGTFGQGFVMHRARRGRTQEADFSLAEVADDHIFVRVRFFLPL